VKYRVVKKSEVTKKKSGDVNSKQKNKNLQKQVLAKKGGKEKVT